MKKKFERDNPSSCWNKATDEELTFILLERDIAAPATIRFWINERIRQGKNLPGDDQTCEAEHCASCMESNRKAEAAIKERIAMGIKAAMEDSMCGMPLTEVYAKYGVKP